MHPLPAFNLLVLAKRAKLLIEGLSILIQSEKQKLSMNVSCKYLTFFLFNSDANNLSWEFHFEHLTFLVRYFFSKTSYWLASLLVIVTLAILFTISDLKIFVPFISDYSALQVQIQLDFIRIC